MGSVVESDEDEVVTDNRFLQYFGEDRGANILIQDSEFLSSSFCKGLLYYSRFKTISFKENPSFLNYTSNFQGAFNETVTEAM